jgi:hypothetical protein
VAVNSEGFHGGGAAHLALQWGAVWGQGVGLQGQTYAIPTMFDTAEEIKPYVDEFLTPGDIAPLFKPAIDEDIENVYLPESFRIR